MGSSLIDAPPSRFFLLAGQNQRPSNTDQAVLPSFARGGGVSSAASGHDVSVPAVAAARGASGRAAMIV